MHSVARLRQETPQKSCLLLSICKETKAKEEKGLCEKRYSFSRLTPTGNRADKQYEVRWLHSSMLPANSCSFSASLMDFIYRQLKDDNKAVLRIKYPLFLIETVLMKNCNVLTIHKRDFIQHLARITFNSTEDRLLCPLVDYLMIMKFKAKDNKY